MNTEFADDLRRVHAEFDLLRQRIAAMFQGQPEAGSVLPALEHAQTALAGVLPENTGAKPTDLLPGEGRSSNLHPSPPPEEAIFTIPSPFSPAATPDQSSAEPTPAPDQSSAEPTPAPDQSSAEPAPDQTTSAEMAPDQSSEAVPTPDQSSGEPSSPAPEQTFP